MCHTRKHTHTHFPNPPLSIAVLDLSMCFHIGTKRSEHCVSYFIFHFKFYIWWIWVAGGAEEEGGGVDSRGDYIEASGTTTMYGLQAGFV